MVDAVDGPGTFTRRWRPVYSKCAERLCADPQRKMKTASLQVQELAFNVESATVATKRPARSNHPVTRDADRDWIPVIRHPHGPVRVRMPNAFTHLSPPARPALPNL